MSTETNNNDNINTNTISNMDNDWLEEEKRFCGEFMGNSDNGVSKESNKIQESTNNTEKKLKECVDVNEAFDEIANFYVEYKKPEIKDNKQNKDNISDQIKPKEEPVKPTNKKNKKNNQKNPKINLNNGSYDGNYDDNYDNEYDDTYDNYYD